MAVAAEALLRLKAVLDDEGFRKAQAALKDLDGQASRAGGTINSRVNRPLDRMDRTLDNINDSRAMRNVDRGLVTTGAGIAGAVKLAIDFEKEFSGVRKQLGVDPSSPILNTYRKQLLDLSTRTPTTAAQLARIATEGAKIGLRDNGLLEYVDQLQRASKAMDIPAEELVGNFNGINAALQLSPKRGYRLLDAINALDDNLPANVTSKQIVEAMSRVGSIPRVAGLQPEDTAALLAPIIGANIAPEIAATGLKNFLTPLAGGGISLSKEKRNLMAQLYGYDDPGLKYLADQKKRIQAEIQQIESGVDKRGLKIGLSQLDKKALTRDVDQAITSAQASGNKQLVKQLKQQRKAILDGANDGLVTDKRQQLLDKFRLKELKDQLKGIDQQIKGRPGSEAYGSKVADYLKNRMQVDPKGTILEVIDKINAMPKADRLGFVQELFGKESGAQIMTLIDNAKLLRQSFDIVDPKNTLGSVKKEYDTLLQGAPAQLEMFRNALMAPAIEIGRTLLPALLELTRALKPAIDQFTAFVRANPQAVQNFVKLAAAVGGLRAALWALGGVVATLRGIKAVFKAIGTAGAFLWDLPRTIAGTLGAVGPLLARLKGMFAGGGGGIFAGLITAAQGLGARVMGPIRGLISMIKIAFAGLTFAEVFPGLARRLAQLRNMVSGIFGKGGGAGNALGKAANNIRPTVLRPMNNIRPFTRIPPIVNPMPWLGSMGPSLAALGARLLTFGSVVARVFMGPVGWVTLLVAAGIALYTFRDKIIGFAKSIAPVLEKALLPFMDFILGTGAAKAGQQGAPTVGFNPLAALNPAVLGTQLANAIGGAMATLGARLAPIWAQISTLFTTYVVTPIQTVWNWLVVWIGQTVAAYAIVWWQGVVSGFNLYVVTPLQQIWAGLMNAFRFGVQSLASIWAGISQTFYTWVVIPVQTSWAQLVGLLSQSVTNVRNLLSQAWAGVSQAFYGWVVQPISQAWQGLLNLFYGTTGPLRTTLSSAWQGVAQGFSTWVVQPVNNAWNALNTNLRNAWGATVRFFTGAWSNVANGIRNGVIQPLQNMFDGLASRVRSVFDGLLGWARGIGNWIVNRVNPVRQAAGFQPLPGFAKGGYVNGPTLAWVGEGKDSEYIIPSSKMAGAAQAYLAGARGASVLRGANGIRGFAKGGFVKGKGGPGSVVKTQSDGSLSQQQIDRMLKEAEKLSAIMEKSGKYGATMFQGKIVYHDAPNALQEIQALRKKAGLDPNNFSFSSRSAVNSAYVEAPNRPGTWQAIPSEFGKKMQAELSGATFKFMGQTITLRPGQKRYIGFGPGGLWGNRNLQIHGGMMSPDQWNKPWKFAKGGFVTRPTLGLIGEGRDSEYIIPSSRMAASSMAYLSGARGMGVVNPPRFANGGVVGPTRNRSANLNALMERSGGGIGSTAVVVEAPTINATIQVQTGDVIEFQGEQRVSMADFMRGMRTVQNETMALLRTSQGRRATGR